MSEKKAQPAKRPTRPGSNGGEEARVRLRDLRQRRAEALEVIAEGLFALMVQEGHAGGRGEQSETEEGL
jgi:hypothetical protein